MSFASVRKLENELGLLLPADYRAFLSNHDRSYLEPHLLVRHVVPVPGSGPEDLVSALYTAEHIVKTGRLGEPREAMLVVGDVEPGGYLYMCFAPGKVGHMFIRFPFQDTTSYPVGSSFTAFMERCRSEPEGDA